MSKKIDLTGQKFGRLTVLSEAFVRKGQCFWLCQCDCGKEKIIGAGNLVSETTKSCGCLQRDIAAECHMIHGYATNFNRAPEYGIWLSMKDRCNNPNNKFYSRYGGRGIKVCSAWNNSFETFLCDMGERPSDRHSLDRFPDNNGNYEPSNCRWTTDFAQNRNKRNNQWIVYNGKSMIIADFIQLIGYTGKDSTIRYQLKTKSPEEVEMLYKKTTIQ